MLLEAFFIKIPENKQYPLPNVCSGAKMYANTCLGEVEI